MNDEAKKLKVRAQKLAASKRYYWRHREQVLTKKRANYRPKENAVPWYKNPAFKAQQGQFDRLQSESSRARARESLKKGIAKRMPQLRENLVRARSHPNFLRSDKMRESRVANIRIAKEAAMRSPRFAWVLKISGPDAIGAKFWRLRSPRNQTFEFRNVRHFVRLHPELFAPDDVIWKNVESSKSAHCNASHGLSSLSPDRKHPSPSWKGWTWASTCAVAPAGHDILNRISVPV